ncbi:hypothetical protein [Deinococcus aetherius]|uniref:hypothetical protein n=1 Tax=Deinococcus aetherius TaxID=200252 RepID=UPI0022306424|nr:hypothetical protein [Deinococcus aetherius]
MTALSRSSTLGQVQRQPVRHHPELRGRRATAAVLLPAFSPHSGDLIHIGGSDYVQ